MKKIVSVKNMIETAITKSNILRLSMIKGAWESISDNFWLKSEPIRLREGLLYVMVENSTYLHAMTMKKRIYIEQINKLLKGEYVVDIDFRVGKIDLQEKIERGENIELFEKTEEEPVEHKTQDMSIEESIKYLSSLSKKREAALLERGYKKCPGCNKIIWGQKEMCTKCKGEENLTINRY